MLEKWQQYQAENILTELDSEGNRLLSLFAFDYKKIMQEDLCGTCGGFSEKFKNFIKKLEKMENKKELNSGFVLNPMYDNIPLSFGSQIYVNSENLTNDYALQLFTEHPLGEELFLSVPENTKELIVAFEKSAKKRAEKIEVNETK